jgi:glutamate dehydrogenase
MEGIHLRSGKISRGGIRWSDRLDDFRTEVLGLMQTQISKNALIVPTGAKGGFVVKSGGHKQDIKDAGKQAYIRLIRGMLDLTDNYGDNGVIGPPELIIYDDPDPYLVVAADKGTAKFSDVANSIAEEYNFWLHDAFASGGSRGYDHKALGITARGAWECVKRHFRELGKDIQREAFTVIGVGSMDGDVFGNGMLQSHCISLLAAFSGQHIFIDPKPLDLEAAYNERKRLFELPGSTWDDYDRNLISKGGGVYLRTAKDITISPELKKWLGIRYNSLDGESLIRYLLTAQVELLWLGGIGTYVKASTEKHEEAGDRGNDNVRVDACDLAAKVVGEGANLGFTQNARIEYNLRGGRINTDAVDNSAGVDTSDHEVNLKILLTGLKNKRLISDYQSLFMEMTDAVCQLVLNDNINQSLCLSLDQIRSAEDSLLFLQVAEQLESAGFLDKGSGSFAQPKEIQARPGQLISRPELADLMAAAKMYLTHHLLDQPGLLADDCYDRYLQAYFPDQIRLLFNEHIAGHPLAREIKATVISNKIINQTGCDFLNLNNGKENGVIFDVVSCYLAFEEILQADKLRQAISALDTAVNVEWQYRLLIQLEQVLLDFCRWSVNNKRIVCPNPPAISQYRQHLLDYQNYVNQHPSDKLLEQVNQYEKEGIPETLAQSAVFIANSQRFPFIVLLISETRQDVTMILSILDDINNTLGLNAIREDIKAISVRDVWEKKVVNDLLEDTQRFEGQLLKEMLSTQTGTCADYFELPINKRRLNKYQRVYFEIENSVPNVLTPYVILIRALKNLLEA